MCDCIWQAMLLRSEMGFSGRAISFKLLKPFKLLLLCIMELPTSLNVVLLLVLV